MKTTRFNKAERAALERRFATELAALARKAKSDSYYAYLDGRNARACELARKAMYFAKVSIAAGGQVAEDR